MTIKLYSWNVNGIRALMKKDLIKGKSFGEWVKESSADVICLQETKAQKEQLSLETLNIPGYKSYFASAEKKGYSGVAVYVKNDKKPNITTGLGIEKFDKEGRTIIVEYDNFTLINVYIPNGKKNEERLDYKMDFKKALEDFCNDLVKKGKRVVITGDVNTAHNEIDLANPKSNKKTSGFLQLERDWITNYIKSGYIDSFRHLHPDEVKYSWWSMRTNSRAKNVGWRLDYFFISKSLLPQLKKADILTDVYGSDHCPIILELSI